MAIFLTSSGKACVIFVVVVVVIMAVVMDRSTMGYFIFLLFRRERGEDIKNDSYAYVWIRNYYCDWSVYATEPFVVDV
jgi:hypothetical protein